jgi:thiol:disulfide interchange protein
MRYSMVGPLFSFPLWLISTFFKDPASVIVLYNFLLFAFALFILYRWLKGSFEWKFLLTFGLILSFGSMLPGHLLSYYGEVFSAVFLTIETAPLSHPDPHLHGFNSG